MRKIYAVLAGIIISLASIHSAKAGTVTPDVANFNITIDAPNNNVFFTNTSVIGSEPGYRRAYWNFGDGIILRTGPLDNTQHHYQVAGTYNVCLRIYRYFTNIGDSVLTAYVCKTVVIQAVCNAEFVTLAVSANPLLKYFVAQPSHNQNKKPTKICWQFGDGRDTCINYPTNYTGTYGVSHLYAQPGNYNVCVNILYDGGCQAHKCHPVNVINPDSCGADFERLPSTNANPLLAYFKALPQHSNNRKPSRICWTFGEGGRGDTCINYPETFTGQYVVSHTYLQQGQYPVCVNIRYYGGCEANKCKPIQIGRPDTCGADFERLQPVPTSLSVYLKALPSHNNNRKPSRICWTFGEGGRGDTCINYPENFTGQYVTFHNYLHPGQYQVCVNIRYYGGCEASKCKPILVGRPDTCGADFEKIASTNANPLLAYYKALPSHNNNRKPSRICWTFGEGGRGDTCINYPETFTGQYVVSHTYLQPGQYQVCVNIKYFGGCEASKCKPIHIGRPDTCGADFERINAAGTNPLHVYLKALPSHNNNRKPSRICWTFGEGGRGDTCINYPETFTGQYVISHTYLHPGQYQVCVNIKYYGGCEASKCKPVQAGPPDSCRADFERIQPTANNPLRAYFRALPWHNNNKKPQRICWRFGEGGRGDTCINYPNNYTGQYVAVHEYLHPGLYNVCVNILYEGGCQADKCKPVPVGQHPDTCGADFERLQPAPTSLSVYLKALPSHNNNRKPSKVCWHFGDGRDTCINYPESFTGQYVVFHQYAQPGQYQVCVEITYYGGCVATKCKPIQVGGTTATCAAEFERLLTPGANPMLAYYKALPLHSNNSKPSKVCWRFGDGRDTCINYTASYTGQYVVSHLYAQPGQYNVCVEITYFGGCVATKCKIVPIPGSNQPILVLSPNPVVNILHVYFFSMRTETVNIKIFNSTGNPVRTYTQNVTAGANTWTHDLSNLQQGVYSYTVQSPTQLASAAFIKL